jgi:hypothetical protein
MLTIGKAGYCGIEHSRFVMKINSVSRLHNLPNSQLGEWSYKPCGKSSIQEKLLHCYSVLVIACYLLPFSIVG